MSVSQSKLKSSKQLLESIDELDNKKSEILEYSDESILRFIMDTEERHISEEIAKKMTEVTDAYRITLAQLINEEIDRKAGLLDKIKLKDK
mgnify:CR=1 FL=1